MNLSLFIARKYFYSGKIRGVIHVISSVSLLGIAVGSFALIVILSSFNGFEEVVTTLYNKFNSDLKITPVAGKYFALDSLSLDKIKKMDGVMAITPVIEENALLQYKDQQTIARFKAVNPEFIRLMGLDSMMLAGSPALVENKEPYALVGETISFRLNLKGADEFTQLQVFVPRRGNYTGDPMKAFNNAGITTGGIYSVQQELDAYIVLPLTFARQLMDEPLLSTSLEIRAKKGADVLALQQNIQKLIGNKYNVYDRHQQEPSLYKVMKTEKFSVYLILSLVLLISAANIIGAILMLALEKKKDMMILLSMGATRGLAQQILLMEGLLLTGAGAVLGLSLGTVVCWLQMKYAIIKLPSNTTLVINAFPIALKMNDFILVGATILIIGLATSWFPARSAYRRLGIEDLRR